MQTRGQDSRLEMVGSAAAGIAHDINNQLTLILNYLAMSDVEPALRAASRCSALTASLLSYCKGEDLELQDLDLGRFLRDFVEHLRLPQGIRVTAELPGELGSIRADPLGLTRALMNLISNASDAMNGVGALRIHAARGMVAVEDSGPGIPAESLKSIFEPFFSTKGSRGTGLGLAIVREIMRQHGGSVNVRSQVGRGTRFELRLRIIR